MSCIEIVLRPNMLEKPVEIYDSEESKYPDRLRVSFANGHTAVYELRVEQPAPVILENIQIIRRMKNGYQCKQRRARR